MNYELLGDYETHVAQINDILEQAGIDRDAELVELDHLAWRTETMEQYHAALERFAPLGENLGEVMVENRPIAAIALRETLVAGGWRIPFLEVAAPKEGSPYAEGLEHAEFVVRGLLRDFQTRHEALGFKLDAADRPVNPELKLKQFPITLKFHQLSIGSVVMIENALAREKKV
jgi:uncharacterized protein